MMIEDKQIKTNRLITIFSCLEWLLLFVTANFIALVTMIYWSQMTTLSFIGFGLCILWMAITRLYKGAINATKEHNKELTEILIEELKANKKI